MLLSESANAVGLRFAGIRLLVSCLPFNPIELFEKPERPLGRTAAFLSGFEGIDEAPPRMGHASDVDRAIQRPPGGVVIAHQYAAVIAEEGLGVNLAAARLIIEKHDRLVTVTVFRCRFEPASSIPTNEPHDKFLTFFHHLVSTSFRWTPNAKAQSINVRRNSRLHSPRCPRTRVWG